LFAFAFTACSSGTGEDLDASQPEPDMHADLSATDSLQSSPDLHDGSLDAPSTDAAADLPNTDAAADLDVAEPTGLPEGPSSERHTKWAKGSKYETQGFWEYLPAGYGTGEKWPLMIFYHGLGENGDGSDAELDEVAKHGPPQLINDNNWPVPGSGAGDAFIVLSVQNSQEMCHLPDDMDAFLRWAVAEYDVDPDRIYLTGLSCGGIGIWEYLRERLGDELVAAVVPISGLGQDAWAAHECALGAVPIWAFHGVDDPLVDVSGTMIPIEGLAQCTDPMPVDAKMTLFEGVAHDAWTATYNLSAGHDPYTWLLGHSKPAQSP